MKRFFTPVLLLAISTVLLTACSNLGRVIATGLEGRLTGIVCGSDGSVTASWHVTNTNVFPYLFSRVASKVYINGTYVGSMLDENPMGIPASAEVERSGRITGGDAAASRVLAEALAQGTASYRVDTQITIRIYDDTVEKSVLTNSGTVTVKAK